MRPSRIQNATTRKSDAPTATWSSALRSAATSRSASASEAIRTSRAFAPRASLKGATTRSALPASASSMTSPETRAAGPRPREKTVPSSVIVAAMKSESMPSAACRESSARKRPRCMRTVAPSSFESWSSSVPTRFRASAVAVASSMVRLRISSSTERWPMRRPSAVATSSVAASTAAKRRTSWSLSDTGAV